MVVYILPARQYIFFTMQCLAKKIILNELNHCHNSDNKEKQTPEPMYIVDNKQ